jgi:hypothetical protein
MLSVIYAECHLCSVSLAECHYAEYCGAMLSVANKRIKLNVVMLSAIMLNIVAAC